MEDDRFGDHRGFGVCLSDSRAFDQFLPYRKNGDSDLFRVGGTLADTHQHLQVQSEKPSWV